MIIINDTTILTLITLNPNPSTSRCESDLQTTIIRIIDSNIVNY